MRGNAPVLADMDKEPWAQFSHTAFLAAGIKWALGTGWDPFLLHCVGYREGVWA